MKLYGTRTSPFVRRVRVVALELGLPIELVDASTDAGQAALRAVSPIWKMPVVEIDGELIWDSHAIIDYLMERHGHGPLRPVTAPWRESNLQHAIDGALDAAINVFYLTRDRVDVSQIPYMVKQQQRVAHAMTWLAGELRAHHFTDDPRLGLTELALVTALDWMRLRAAYPVADSPALTAFLAHHAPRPSLTATLPG